MATEFEYIDFESTGGIATLRFQRPSKKNAINSEIRNEIASAVELFDQNREMNILVVTGSGDSFSAGTDIEDLENRLPDTAEEAIFMSGFDLPERIADLDKPSIAMLNGVTLGGGLELALACDIRIAAADIELGFPEITLGGYPSEGGTQRFPRETNVGTALLYILTGETFDSTEAKERGIVQRVYPSEDLEQETKAIAEKIAEKELASVILAKRSVKLTDETSLPEGLELETLLSHFLEITSGRKNRINEFLE